MFHPSRFLRQSLPLLILALCLSRVEALNQGNIGAIVLNNLGERGAYQILLDGNPILERQLAQISVGAHELVIHQKRLVGEVTLIKVSLQVQSNSPTKVSFVVPYLTFDEQTKTDELAQAVDDLWNDPHAGTKMDAALAQQEAFFADVSCSPRLAELQKAARARTLAWPAQNQKPHETPAKLAKVEKPTILPGPKSFGWVGVTGSLQQAAVWQNPNVSLTPGGTSSVGVDLFVPFWYFYGRLSSVYVKQKFTNDFSNLDLSDSVEAIRAKLGFGANFPIFEQPYGLELFAGGNWVLGNINYDYGNNYSGLIGGEVTAGAAWRLLQSWALALEGGMVFGGYHANGLMVRTSAGWAF